MRSVFRYVLISLNVASASISGYLFYHATLYFEKGRFIFWQELEVLPAFLGTVISLIIIVGLGLVPQNGRYKSFAPVLVLVCAFSGLIFAPIIAKIMFGIQLFAVSIAYKFWLEDPRSKARGVWRYHGSGKNQLNPDGYSINEVAAGHDQKRPHKPLQNEDFPHKWQK